jgi:hypothetical protein
MGEPHRGPSQPLKHHQTLTSPSRGPHWPADLPGDPGLGGLSKLRLRPHLPSRRGYQAAAGAGKSGSDRRNFRKDRRYPPHRRSVLRECTIPSRQRAKG